MADSCFGQIRHLRKINILKATFNPNVDNTMTIDTYVDKFGNEHGKSDSVWNFHVWNECWLNRRDLPAGYGNVYKIHLSE